MLKKIASLFLVAALLVCSVVALSSCGDTEGNGLKVGVILIGDDTEGYSKAHIDGIKAAAKNLGLSDSQIIWKYKVAEDSSCSEASEDLIGSGCSVVISNSYGHQTFIAEIAKNHPEVTFLAMTGDFAKVSGIPNLKNAFTKVYESRYVSGVVAGLKLKELTETGVLTTETQPESFDENGNIKVGYVGAHPFAEVVSGYTAFYLGIKSVMPNVAMEVNYTNSWFDIDKEGQAAKALISNGCVIIGQHADSTGAPAETEKLNQEGKICYSVGYNVDMIETAPNAALTSATNNWVKYYEYALGAAMKGEEVATDWAEGFSEDAVAITALNTNCAEGTQEYVDGVIAKIKDGSLKVFDTENFTVGGEAIDSYEVDLSYMDFTTTPPTVVYEGEKVETIVDGAFSESEFRAAPYFDIRIDGITEK